MGAAHPLLRRRARALSGQLFPERQRPSWRARTSTRSIPARRTTSVRTLLYGPTYDATQDRNQFRLPRPARHGSGSALRLHGRPAHRDGREQLAGVDQPDASATSGGNFSKYGVLARSRLHQLAGAGAAISASPRAVSTIRSGRRPIWSGTANSASMASPCRPGTRCSKASRRSRWPARSRSTTPISTPDINLAIRQRSGPPQQVCRATTSGCSAARSASTRASVRNMRSGSASPIYDFDNVQGQLSSPCIVETASADVCDTDMTRPSFAQKG